MLPRALAITFVLPKKSLLELAVDSPQYLKGKIMPAVIKFAPHILEVSVAHILHREHKAILVLVQAFSYIRKELES